MKPCAFCDRELADVAKLISGPIAICDRCVQEALQTTEQAEPVVCSFCRQVQPPALRTGAHAICLPCVDLCCDILRETRVELPRAIVHRDNN